MLPVQAGSTPRQACRAYREVSRQLAGSTRTSATLQAQRLQAEPLIIHSRVQVNNCCSIAPAPQSHRSKSSRSKPYHSLRQGQPGPDDAAQRRQAPDAAAACDPWARRASLASTAARSQPLLYGGCLGQRQQAMGSARARLPRKSRLSYPPL